MTREDKIRNKAVNEQRLLMESMDYRAGFISGATWADKTMLEKVCEYLKSLVYQEFGGGPIERTFSDEDIEEFKKAMEE